MSADFTDFEGGRLLPAPISSAELAARVGGEHLGEAVTVSVAAPLASAGPEALAYAEKAVSGAAGVVLCKERFAAGGRTCVVVKDPKLAFITLLTGWFAEVRPPGVHPTAAVEGTLGEGVHIGPHAVVGAGAHIGAGAAVLAGAVVGERCQVGPGTVIHPRAVLYPDTVVGSGCIIHSGAVIGADGFSYHPTAKGPTKVPQVGRVRLGDGVEIGANTCVDRAFLTETVVGDGSAMDNLVQVGHNSRLGRFNLLAAQVGISGSVTLGDGVIVGGQAGFADHVKVGDRAIIGSRAGVHNDLEGRAVYLFAPAMPIRKARRVIATLGDLPEMRSLVYKLARQAGLLD